MIGFTQIRIRLNLFRVNNGLLIEGNNVHVFKYVDAAPLEIVCATTMSLKIVQELIGATTPESGTAREKRPRLIEYFLSLGGATTSENDGDVSIFYMQNKIREVHDLEIVYTDNNGDDKTFRANFYTADQTINGNSGEASTYDINLEGSGDYEESTLPDPVVSGTSVKSDSYTVASGKIQDNEWIGLSAANIIEVCREGSEQLSLGLPYSFNSITGEITPDAATTIDGQRMFVIWTY